MNVYNPNYKIVENIFIKQIIFDRDFENINVTIYGLKEIPESEYLENVSYCCDFSILTDLLLLAEEKGQPINKAITDLLNLETEENPLVIDILNVFEEVLYIDKIILQIYKPMLENEFGYWVEENPDEEFYIIDSVESKENFSQNQNYQQKFNDELTEYLLVLNNAYQYYLQLKKVNMPDKLARKKAGLKDELLFRIAVLNYKIIKNGEN